MSHRILSSKSPAWQTTNRGNPSERPEGGRGTISDSDECSPHHRLLQSGDEGKIPAEPGQDIDVLDPEFFEQPDV